MIMVYVTCRDKKEAVKISRYLINKKLIACSNYFPINSIYRWNKKIIRDKEYVLLLKTLNKNYDKIKKEIKKVHSYNVPFIGKLDVTINRGYEKYLIKEVK